MTDNLVSGAQLSRMYGVSRQAVYQARKAGRIQLAGLDAKGRPLFDPAAVQRVFGVDIVQASRPSGLDGGRPALRGDGLHGNGRTARARSNTTMP